MVDLGLGFSMMESIHQFDRSPESLGGTRTSDECFGIVKRIKRDTHLTQKGMEIGR